MDMPQFTAKGVARGFALFVGIMGFLYFFLVGLDLLGSAFKVIAGDSAGTLFSAVENPIAGLMVGILATVLVQSSSTTTSIIVSAAGAGVLPVVTGIPMVMGANIGTSVTNTIVSLGFVADREQYRRGFAGATVHDMFNYMNVCLWLPLEVVSSAFNGGNGGILFLLSKEMAKSFEECDSTSSSCTDWEGPLKIITAEISKAVIDADKDVIKDFSFGRPDAAVCAERLCDVSAGTCSSFKFNQKRCSTETTASIGTQCGATDPATNKTVSKKAKAAFSFCSVVNGSIVVDNAILTGAQNHYDSYKLNKAGVFADAGLDREAGWIVLIMSLIILIISLIGMVKLLGIAVRGTAEDAMKKALNMNGYLAILVGCGVTMFVQSSSITTSTLTPLVAMGTLSLQGMLPLTLGANIGTTLTGVLASLVGDSALGFQIAMVHVMFNVFGVAVFYPVPKIRALPIAAATRLGDLAATFKSFPIFYIFMLFLVYPGFFLALSIGFEAGGGGLAGAIVGLLAFIVLHAGIFIWYTKRGGREWLQKSFGHDFDGTAKVDVNPMAM